MRISIIGRRRRHASPFTTPRLEHLERRVQPVSASLLGALFTYNIPTPNSQPQAIVLGPDNNLWFTESASNKIGMMTPAGSFKEYTVPTPHSMPYAIASAGDIIGTDAQGNLALYFTEYQGGKLGEITTSGVITEGPVVDSHNNPVPGTQLVDLALEEPGFAWVSQNNSRDLALFDLSVDPPSFVVPRVGFPPPQSSTNNSGNSGVAIDRNFHVYFTETNANRIAVYTVNNNTSQGATTEFAIAGGENPANPTLASDGNIWFTYTNTASGQGELAQFNVTTQTITSFAIPSGHVATGLAAQQDGPYIYFTTSSTIGRINVNNGIVEEDTQTLANGGGVRGLTIGLDDDPWFVLSTANQVAEYRPIAFVTHSIPTAQSQPNAITLGPDGNIWFTEQNTGNVGQINTATGAIQEFGALAGDTLNGITTGPDQNLWITLVTPQGTPEIAKMATNGGVLNVYPVPIASEQGEPEIPELIIAGPNGNLWYTDPTFVQGTVLGGVVRQMTTSGQPVGGTIGGNGNNPNAIGGPTAMTSDVFGNVWIGFENDLVGATHPTSIMKVAPNGAQTVFNGSNLSQGNRFVLSMTSDSSGNVWFTEYGVLGQIAPGGQPQVRGLSVMGLGGNVADLATWVGGTLLSPDFNEHVLNLLIPPSQQDGLLVPGVQPGLGAIAIDQKANAWFTAPNSNAIIQLTFPSGSATLTPAESFISTAYRRLTGVPISTATLSQIEALVVPRPSSLSSPGGPAPLGAQARLLVVRAILNSQDYRAHVVRVVYQQFLHQPPSAQQLAAGMRFLQHGGKIEGLEATVLGSRSYFRARGGSSLTGYIQALSHDVLGSDPTAAALRRSTRKLAHGESPRTLAASLIKTNQAQQPAVDRAFRFLLHRPASITERQLIAPITARRGIRPLIAALVSSGEFLGQVR